MFFFIIILGLAFAGFTSWGLTDLIRKYAIKKNILDIPNERSSHVRVTPRGGGLGFVMVFTFSVVILTISKFIPFNIGSAIIGGGVLIAIIGWLDDKKGLTAKTRFIFHLIAAVWALGWLGGLPSLDVGFKNLYLSELGWLIGILGIVWMINLYNFMDGIDGLAGIEAVMVTSFVSILLFYSGSMNIAMICALLAVSVMGFLVWNWPPAKIFMGDVGSGFLGYVLAVLAVVTEQSTVMPLLVWTILLSVFLIDATVTLIRRIIQGEKWNEAHRSHVYQLAIRAGYSHKQVTLQIAGINLLLMILSIIALFNINWMLFIVISLILILLVLHGFLYWKFNRMINIIKNTTHLHEELKGYGEIASIIKKE